jgi:adenosine deaminase
MDQILKEKLHCLPKVDLHRHLEGSLRLETLSEIAQQHNVSLNNYDIEAIRPLAQVTEDHIPDFHGFLEKFKFLRQFYSSREAIERVAYEAVADAAADNVKYLELRFSPYSLALNQGFPLEEVMDWVTKAVDKAQREWEIKTRLLVTIVREFDRQTSLRIAMAAIAYAPEGVVGLDLAGDETSHSMHTFADIFQMAREAGLGITVHAGEARSGEGADSVRMAVELLGAQRIGHGIRAGEDPAVLDLLRRKKVALEMCPTSNLQTGAVKELSNHPLRDFHRQGVTTTINTDDPSVSDIILTDEYQVAIQDIGISMSELKEIILNGVRVAFLPSEEKERLGTWFRKTLEENESPFLLVASAAEKQR